MYVTIIMKDKEAVNFRVGRDWQRLKRGHLGAAGEEEGKKL